MAFVNIQVQTRQATKKSGTRKLRAKNIVPGVYYSHGQAAIALEIEEQMLVRVLREAGRSSLLKLSSTTKELNEQFALIKEVQIHPVKDTFLHIDLQGVSLKEKIRIAVPLHFEGQAKGELEGWTPEIQLHELHIRCQADQIPHDIKINISDLGTGDVLHVSQIKLPQGVELDTDANLTVVTMVAPRAAVEEVAAPVATETATPAKGDTNEKQ